MDPCSWTGEHSRSCSGDTAAQTHAASRSRHSSQRCHLPGPLWRHDHPSTTLQFQHFLCIQSLMLPAVPLPGCTQLPLCLISTPCLPLSPMLPVDTFPGYVPVSNALVRLATGAMHSSEAQAHHPDSQYGAFCSAALKECDSFLLNCRILSVCFVPCSVARGDADSEMPGQLHQ